MDGLLLGGCGSDVHLVIGIKFVSDSALSQADSASYSRWGRQ